MQAERLKLLNEFIKDEPNDPFNHYVLALEYLKFDLENAILQFDNLLINFPDYLPTYYHAAALFYDLEEIQKAKNIYHLGIKLSVLQKNTKAEAELSRALKNLIDEELI